MPTLARSASDTASDRAPRLALSLVLLVAAALRLWAVRHDLPFSYFGDELHFMRRAMAVGTGDLNPHWFHKPAFLMYLLAFCYGLYFLFGRIAGAFHSTAEFGAHFLFNPTSFLVIGRLLVAACGVATVYVVYRIGRKVFANPWAGIAGATVAAVLAPMVNSSRTIKSDVPCGLLMALSVWAFLGTRESPARGRWWSPRCWPAWPWAPITMGWCWCRPTWCWRRCAASSGAISPVCRGGR